MDNRLSLRGMAMPLLALATLLSCQGTAHAAHPHGRDPFQAPPGIPSAVAPGAPMAGALPVAGGVPGATAAAGNTLAAVAELQLRAVIFDAAGSLANINGHIVGVGESVDDYVVVSIGPRSVQLRHGARRLTLTMNQKENR